MRRLFCGLFACMLCFSMSVNAQASEVKDEVIIEPMEDAIYYDVPVATSEEAVENESLLISSADIEKMTVGEFEEFLKGNTPLSKEEIEQIVSYYQSEDYKNGVAPAYGIYDHPEWEIEPKVISTQKYVAYATSWIGIDAYRSSVGMTKGKTEQKTITYTLGYSGDAKIKEYKNTLSASYTNSTTTTISESQTCPAWTTMNWRPYATYWLDEYYGKMKITTIIPSAGGVYENVWYEEFSGTDRRLITDTTEVWSRENTARDKNATTPTPPTGAPNV